MSQTNSSPLLQNSWREVASLNRARSRCSAAAIGNKLYVIAGDVGSAQGEGGTSLKTVEVYDPVSNEWTVFPIALDVTRYEASIVA